MSARWLIYGANGYTGKLIAAYANSRGMNPILAGRSHEPLEQLSQQLGCDYEVFPCETESIVAALNKHNAELVLHCAGPFVHTSRPMVEACLQAKAHYLDITGEMTVLEELFSYDEQAKEQGVVVMGGVGFDVVPTDCLALRLKQQLPDATSLTMAFHSQGGVSRGTAMTMAEHFGSGDAIRRNGKIVTVPNGTRSKTIPFHNGEKWCSGIPWGDVATAYRTTGIPNIEVYLASKKAGVAAMRVASALPFLKPLFKKMADKVVGPSDEDRQKNRVNLWGEVKNDAGKKVTQHLQTSEGYRLTTESSVKIAVHVLQGAVSAGATTPALAFGSDFISQMEDCAFL